MKTKKKLSKKERIGIIDNLYYKIDELKSINNIGSRPGFNVTDEYLSELIIMRAYLDNILHDFNF